ncbi:type I-E CRISPR-associated endoribonuclease Cas2e [Micromonospora sp. NPDC051296]|uniref:type I-E CRISPR-associated endoribonuclease Cas2e n=1 Tax=Micromonospora sp. NPDC051296 TaxID=3155046 RepID=UPI0034240EC0
MTVIILTACPEGLRGHPTHWLLEISAGGYVGHGNSRIRQRLWAKVVEMAGPGRALLVHQQPGGQRLCFQVHDHHWQPVDLDGITLIRRPTDRTTCNAALPGVSSKPRAVDASDAAPGTVTPRRQARGKVNENRIVDLRKPRSERLLPVHAGVIPDPQSRLPDRPLLPVQAGVIPALRRRAAESTTALRARGGDPAGWRTLRHSHVCSPRTRG